MYGTDWNPTPKYQQLVSLLADLTEAEERTVRDCYYALEARGHDYSYDEVKYAAMRGRRAGYLDPSKLPDTSRRAETTPSGVTSAPGKWLEKRVLNSPLVYDRDFWEDQPAYVEVWLEKASLASVFKPVCDDYNVRLETTRGDWSDAKAYAATRRIIGKIQESKHVRILYFGDYNPSGFRTPVAIQQMMYCYGLQLPYRDPTGDWPDDMFYDVSPWDGWPMMFETPGGEWEIMGVDTIAPDQPGVASFDMERVALTTKQLNRFDLPENPNPTTAHSDRDMLARFKTHISEGDDRNVELNALKEWEREYLVDLIGQAIDQYVDADAREENQEKVRDHKEALADNITAHGGEHGGRITVQTDLDVEG